MPNDPIIGWGGDPDFPSVACGDPVYASDLYPTREDFLKATREGQLEENSISQPEITFERRFEIGAHGGYRYSFWTTLSHNGEEFVVSAATDDGIAEDTANRLARAFNVEVNRVGF